MKVLPLNHQGSFDCFMLWIQKDFIGFSNFILLFFDWFFIVSLCREGL